MARWSESQAALERSGWWSLTRITTPGLVYRVAGWRKPSGAAAGRLAVRVRGRGSVRIEYRNAEGGARDECLRRQRWALRVPAAHGASRATLREEGCLADGDGACIYMVT